MAMAYYTHSDSPAHSLHALELSNARILDLRDFAQCKRFDIDPENTNNRWQNERSQGLPASTWVISDAARKAGADGLLSPSRSRPELTHLTLFRWNTYGAPTLCLENMGNSQEQQ